jgi:hypothetical protein
MIFVTTAPPEWRKAYIFDSLAKLSCRTVALLEPSDRRKLPSNVERVPYIADGWNQDGRFLNALDVPSDAVVVLADADAVVQRDPLPCELDPGDGVAMGWNWYPGQTCAEEYGACRPHRHYGDSFGVDLQRVPMRNGGLIAARADTWHWLHAVWADVFRIGGPMIADHTFCQQLFVCIAIEKVHLPLRTLGYATHTHGLGPKHLTDDHTIRDGVLYHRGRIVFFAHHVKGVSH